MATSTGKSVIAQGRLVYVIGGDLWKGAIRKDDRTRQPVIDPKTNQPVVEYGFGLAIPKKLLIDPATNQWIQSNMGVGGPAEFWAVIQSEAASLYTSGMPRDFAWKFKWDFDMDKNNKPYGDREGYKDCIVLNCSTRIPFQVFKHQGAYVQISEGVNAGDWVTVQLSIKAHTAEGNSKAGMYINPQMVLLNVKGDPIVGASANPEMSFGNAAPQAASWMTPATNPAPQDFNQFAGAQQPQAGMPPMPGIPPQQGPVQPNFNVLPPSHQPQGQMNGNQMPGMPGMAQPPQQPAANNYGQPNGAVQQPPMPGPQGQQFGSPGQPMPGTPHGQGPNPGFNTQGGAPQGYNNGPQQQWGPNGGANMGAPGGQQFAPNQQQNFGPAPGWNGQQ